MTKLYYKPEEKVKNSLVNEGFIKNVIGREVIVNLGMKHIIDIVTITEYHEVTVPNWNNKGNPIQAIQKLIVEGIINKNLGKDSHIWTLDHPKARALLHDVRSNLNITVHFINYDEGPRRINGRIIEPEWIKNLKETEVWQL